MRRRTAVSVSALALCASVLVAAVGWPASHGGSPRPPLPSATGTTGYGARLVSYTGCDSFLSAIRARALREVGPYGLPGGYPGIARYATAGPAVQAGTASPGTASTGTAGSGATGAAAGVADPFSATNDQVAGVDEADTVKTDGNLMTVLRAYPAGLEVATVGGLVPRLAAWLPLPEAGHPTGMFLTGGDAVVIGQGQPRYGAAYTPTSIVTVVSLADPTRPSVVRSFTIAGTETAARLIGGRVILVVLHSPTLRFDTPDTPDPAPGTSAEANRRVIRSSTPGEWLPTVTAEPSGTTTIVGCSRAWMADRSGSPLGTVSVLTIDPSSDHLGPTATIMGPAGSIYASADALYVASPDSTGPPVPAAPGDGPAVVDPGSGATLISEFDLSGSSGVRYVGSGTVPGRLIGQYAMDEYRGALRVATTTGEATPPPNEGKAPTLLSDSRITVLVPSGGGLATVATLSGLGRGEKIYSVRFEGPLAYLVTFRQTDPLYVVDLSDPAHPVEKGRLSLTGFSSFLQSLSASLLLGVGQAVDGSLRQSGLQLSVFDVADPAAPSLESRLEIPGGYSQAQYDPHALLWWPPSRLVAMPVSDPATGFVGVVAWQLDAAGALHEVARISPPAPTRPSPASVPGYGRPVDGAASTVAVPALPVTYGSEREVVVGNLFYTVSPGGIMASDMSTWQTVAWLPFE